MNVLPDPKRIVGALRFLAELSAVGAEFTASRSQPDALRVRRLQDDARVAGQPSGSARRARERNPSEVLAVKAL